MSQIKIKIDDRLSKLLSIKLAAIYNVKSYIERKNFRFSHKKFVADLGEYYFHLNCNYLFEFLKQEKSAVAEYDFLGIFAKSDELLEHSKKTVRIEIKTRYAQEGNPYLGGLHIEKFDILAFVFLDENYSCRYIGLHDINEIKNNIDKNRNRLVYKASLSKIISTGEFIPIPKKKKNCKAIPEIHRTI